MAFVLYELRTEHPLIKVAIFRDRGFAVDNVLLFLMSMAFVPLFFFASLYAQIGLEQSASEAGLYLLIFFGGFATAAQFGGRILDSRGARPSVVPGALIATAGFVLWARQLPDLDLNSQWYFIVLTGAGMGLMLGPASTDAVNRAPRTSYGEVTGHHPDRPQLRREPGHGPARHDLHRAEQVQRRVFADRPPGSPKARADQIADAVSHAGGGASSGFSERAGPRARELFETIQHDFALSSRDCLLRHGRRDGARLRRGPRRHAARPGRPWWPRPTVTRSPHLRVSPPSPKRATPA